MRTIAETLWFFLPAFFANQCPGFAAKLDVPGNTPVSVRWLGANKTWSAYWAGAAGGMLVFALQQCVFQETNVRYGWYVANSWGEIVVIGTLFGVGAIIGDHGESFIKRRIGIAPGKSWWPFDQIDFAVGALLCIYPIAGWIGWDRVLIICVVAIVGHPILNWVGYRVGIRKTWH